MSDPFNFSRLKGQRLNSLLGLTLDGSRLEGVVLRRNNGSLLVQETFAVTLSLDPLTADPELVGREIRNHLDAAEVRERVCVVGLPLKWALTAHVEVPPLPDADVASFLDIEAERSFPSDVSTLWIAKSSCGAGIADAPARGADRGSKQSPVALSVPGSDAPAGQHALLVGVPRNNVALLERALRAAKLKPVSFSLAITALESPLVRSSHGVMALAIGETNVGLQVTCGGGIAALRTLEGTLETEGSRKVLHTELIAREARITLGQLSSDVRDTVKRIRIFGPRDLSQQLADELELRLEPLGLKVELVARYTTESFGMKLPDETQVSSALSLAAERLAGRKTPLEFLPPTISPWRQAASRYSSGKYGLAGALAGLILLLVVGAFAVQQWQLVRLRAQWAGMSGQVRQLEGLQAQIRQYRPWFDDSFRTLNTLRQFSTAFPEDGVVTAKSIEIRDQGSGTCTGTTRDRQSLSKTQERLKSGGHFETHATQTRGTKAPFQFSFDFRVTEGGRNEN